MHHLRLLRRALLAATTGLTVALLLAPAGARAEESAFSATIRAILQNVRGKDLSERELHAFQNCFINAFAVFTPEQKQGLVDAGVSGGDLYLSKLDKTRANPPAFTAGAKCYELRQAKMLVDSPEAAEPAE
jgi:hypothetical protein